MPSETSVTVMPQKAVERIRGLEQRLRPASSDEASEALMLLFAGLQTSATGEGARLRLTAYLIALREFGLETIQTIIGDILAGRAGLDERWCPTPPQLARLCREREDRLRAELHKACAIAAPEKPSPSPEVLQRYAERLEKLKADIAASADMTKLGRAE